MSGFTKLVPEIVQSSLWNEPAEIRCVWIAMIATKDASGYVRGDARTIARVANVPIESAKDALALFQEPDPSSHTPDNEGRRIIAAPGGWIILNHEIYRARDDVYREKTRQRVKRFRDKFDADNGNVTLQETLLKRNPSASVSASDSEEGDARGIDPHKPVSKEDLKDIAKATAFVKMHPAFSKVPDMAIHNTLNSFSAYREHWPKILRQYQTDNAGVDTLKYKPCQDLRIAFDRYIKFNSISNPHVQA
jgi:hypothetical protein